MSLRAYSNADAALVPAGVRFLIAGLWAFLVFRGSGIVYDLLPTHNLIPGVVYGILGCTLLGAGFFFFVRVLDGREMPPLLSISLPLDRTALRQWIAGLVLGAGLIVANVAAIALFGQLRLHLHLNRAAVLRALLGAAMMLGGALMEEIAFRGYPLQKLAECLGTLWAVLVLSALFGAVHLANPASQGWKSWGFFNTLAVGILFALARIRTGSLWLSFGMHFGWNLCQGTIFGLPVSGITQFASLVTARVHGPVALTGGAYGPEASAACSLVLLAALPITWLCTSARSLQHRTAGR